MRSIIVFFFCFFKIKFILNINIYKLLNNVLKLLLIMQRMTIDEIVFCHTHKNFHPSHVTFVDPDSSDSNRLYPKSVTDPSVVRQSNSIPTKFMLSTPKEVFTSKE